METRGVRAFGALQTAMTSLAWLLGIKLDFLKEQPVLLTAEPSLQPLLEASPVATLCLVGHQFHFACGMLFNTKGAPAKTLHE